MNRELSVLATMFLTVMFGAFLVVSQLDNPSLNIYTIFGFLGMIIGNWGILSMCRAKDKETEAKLKEWVAARQSIEE